MKTHFVFARHFYLIGDEKLKSLILRGMEKYNIKKVMVTIMSRWREKLITKEDMVCYCKGGEEQRSVNDDLDLLFEAIRLDKKSDDHVVTYFLPMLTENELELVERKDSNYLKTFLVKNPDVKEAEMKRSESDSKFVCELGLRRTFTIECQHQQLFSSKLKILSNCS